MQHEIGKLVGKGDYPPPLLGEGKNNFRIEKD
jgi:hypothetical protein